MVDSLSVLFSPQDETATSIEIGSLSFLVCYEMVRMCEAVQIGMCMYMCFNVNVLPRIFTSSYKRACVYNMHLSETLLLFVRE